MFTMKQSGFAPVLMVPVAEFDLGATWWQSNLKPERYLPTMVSLLLSSFSEAFLSLF
jgi:hypothetical protein